jgi:hypothetical protein
VIIRRVYSGGIVGLKLTTHSPYTLGIAISVIDKFQQIKEAKIVVGNPVSHVISSKGHL